MRLRVYFRHFGYEEIYLPGDVRKWIFRQFALGGGYWEDMAIAVHPEHEPRLLRRTRKGNVVGRTLRLEERDRYYYEGLL